MNLIVMLVVWGAGMVVLYRWYLAASLRRAFREEVIAEPVGAGVGEEVRPGGVLNYAEPPRKMSLGRRWPFVYAVFGGAIPFATAMPVVALCILEQIAPAERQILLACSIALLLVVLGCVVVAVRGLSDEGGRPAAARWRYAGRAVLCWVGVMALTWVLLDWRVQRMMDESLARANRLAKELEIVSPDGAAAASLYTRAGVLPKSTIQFEGDWQLVGENGGMAPPSALPDREEFRVPLLRQAAGMKAGGFVPPAASYSVDTQLPHLAGMRSAGRVLRQHAISEARAGRIASAIDDINAINGMGDQTMQGLSLVEMLVGTGLYALADETLQEVLPMVKDQKDLDRLQMDEPTQRMKASIRAGIRGDFGVSDRSTVVMVLRRETDPVPGLRNNTGWGLFISAYRVVLGDREITALEDRIAGASAMVCDDPAVTAGNLAAITAWSTRERLKTPLSAILVAAVHRAVGQGVQAAAMADVSRGAVAATRFRIQKGRLPGSWDELVEAKLMPGVPMDPFDGKPMRFAVHKDFIFIYTIGRDRIDNGGAPFMVGRSGYIQQSNPGMIISGRPLWELDLVPKGFVPATQEAD